MSATNDDDDDDDDDNDDDGRWMMMMMTTATQNVHVDIQFAFDDKNVNVEYLW